MANLKSFVARLPACLLALVLPRLPLNTTNKSGHGAFKKL